MSCQRTFLSELENFGSDGVKEIMNPISGPNQNPVQVKEKELILELTQNQVQQRFGPLLPRPSCSPCAYQRHTLQRLRRARGGQPSDRRHRQLRRLLDTPLQRLSQARAQCMQQRHRLNA